MYITNRRNICRTHLPDTLISHRLVNIYTTTTDEISTKQITTSLRTIYIVPLQCRSQAKKLSWLIIINHDNP